MLKRCTACKREKAHSEFNNSSTRKDGLQTLCKECNNAQAKAYYLMRVEQTGRVCRVCGKTQPSDNFSTVGVVRRRICKECEYERKRDTRTAWDKKNKVQLNARRRAKRKNPEQVPRFVLMDARKSDKRKCLDNDLTLEFVTSVLRRACIYCGETEIRMSLDRVDNSKGHTQANVNPSCIRCNYVRGNMPYEAWLCLVPGLREAEERRLFGAWLGPRLTTKGC